MTAPPKKQRVVNCENKRRYADEFTARAGTSHYLEAEQKKLDHLWIYRCRECGGWHMTSKNQGPRWKITRDEVMITPLDQQLKVKLDELALIEKQLAELGVPVL